MKTVLPENSHEKAFSAKTGTRAFILLSASSMMLTALGIDIILPAFSEIREHFGLGSESTDTARLISFFFLGQVFQIIFGVLSDRMGRIPILRTGFVIYIVFGIATVISPSLWLMYMCRLLTGIGASAVFMSTIAGVRDRFSGDHMARIMSLILTIFLFTPVLAPFLGMGILKLGLSWQVVFLTPPAFAAAVFLWSLKLDESLPPEKRVKVNLASTFQSVKGILKHKTFLRYTLITSFLFTGLSTYISTSEHIVGTIYGKPQLFAWIFASTGLLMALASLSNSWFSIRFGAKSSLKVMLSLYTAVSLLLFAFTISQGNSPAMPLFFVCISLLLSLNLAIEPNSSALALEPMGETAGIAAALYGTIFFLIGSVLSNMLIDFLSHDVLALVIAFLVIGLLCVTLAFSDTSQK